MFKELKNRFSYGRGYIIADDDFECPINGGDDWADFYAAFVQAYEERGLDVAKNLALYVMWWVGGSNIRDNTHWKHDRPCSKIIKNWKQYAKKRDEYLQKMMVWK